MITISNNVKENDRVMFWFSYTNDKTQKKHDEHEFKVLVNDGKTFKIHSESGGYDMIFNEETLNMWWGNCRKC